MLAESDCDIIRLVNHSILDMFKSIQLERGDRTNEYIVPCHPNLLFYKLATSFDDQNEFAFISSETIRDR